MFLKIKKVMMIRVIIVNIENNTVDNAAHSQPNMWHNKQTISVGLIE